MTRGDETTTGGASRALQGGERPPRGVPEASAGARRRAVLLWAGLLLVAAAHYLWNIKRPEVSKRVADAAAEGDRSENAEYIYGKRLLAEIDRRLRFLGKRLDVLEIVSEKPKDDGRVYFGCFVAVEDEEENEKQKSDENTDSQR